MSFVQAQRSDVGDMPSTQQSTQASGVRDIRPTLQSAQTASKTKFYVLAALGLLILGGSIFGVAGLLHHYRGVALGQLGCVVHNIGDLPAFYVLTVGGAAGAGVIGLSVYKICKSNTSRTAFQETSSNNEGAYETFTNVPLETGEGSSHTAQSPSERTMSQLQTQTSSPEAITPPTPTSSALPSSTSTDTAHPSLSPTAKTPIPPPTSTKEADAIVNTVCDPAPTKMADPAS